MKKIYNRILSLLLAVVLAISMFANAGESAEAADEPYTWRISSFEQLMAFIQQSKADNFCEPVKWTILLENDIEITEQNIKDLQKGVYDLASGEKVRSVTIGCQNKKFSGIFDGQGHIISGLNYDSGELGYAADNGLFSYTDGAVIKNFTVTNASIDADYRGGFVAGSADNTRFENIAVKDSYMRVSCSNNVLTLVTDGGLTGGAIAGEAVNCVLYNCVSENTTISNNNTAGVAALGGKGLYLGGLVGTADKGTLIEYSRVIGGEVKSHYDVAVGALGGNTLYVGGIVGQMQAGSKVMDCFATPYLYYYTATYVSVGAGNGGHIGGIAAAAYGSSCEIERCHFAGTMESRQYNAVLVIPIIQKNVNLAGIVDKVADKMTVKGSYFKESRTGDVHVVENDTITSEFGPQEDETYVDMSFWTAHDYDFIGNKDCSNEKNTIPHVNKWVMDYEQGIPVHGKSVAAAFDFPGAGFVTIDATDLVSSSVSTANPYKFAVQGITFQEDSVDLTAKENPGYRFVNWYKLSNVLAASMPEDHSYYDDIFSKNAPISGAGAVYEKVSCADNDLFIARYQAKVLFHDIYGNVINISGAFDDYEADDWYYYADKLPDVMPVNRPNGSEAKFIGWTTIKSTEAGGGYSAIKSAELANLKTQGEFYEAGYPITKAMNLYPVYTDLISKVHTVFEGHEQDSLDDLTQRDGVGTTFVTVGDDGDPVINVDCSTDGYRFIGWYDEAGNLISTEISYCLKNANLTERESYTFTARFEYRVDYYPETKDIIAEINANPYASVWHKYQTIFQHLKDVPLDAEDTFSHWAWRRNEDECSSCADTVSMDHIVVSPIKVYAHITGKSGHDILITSDFPDSSVLSNTGNPGLSNFTIICEPKEGYNFLFWACGTKNKEWIHDESAWKAGAHLTTTNYHYEAHLNAFVTFFEPNQSTVLETVTRHYEEKVLLNEAVTHAYTYPINGDTITDETDISEATPTAADQKNCYFIGWIDGADIKDTEQWSHIYDVSTTQSLTSDISGVAPYLVTETDVVTEPMELYPVYIQYNVETTTNIKEQGVISNMIHIPKDPAFVGIDTSKATSTITVTADKNTYITGDSGEKYNLVSITVRKNGEEIVTLIPDEHGVITYEIEAGPMYSFVADYEPLVVICHIGASTVEIVVRNRGDILGEAPESANVEGAVFAGWTERKPESDWYHSSADEIRFVEENSMVTKSMELWPVYLDINLQVNSNLDEVLNRTNHRDLVAPYTGDGWAYLAEWSVQAQEVNGYEFMGWYKNYSIADGADNAGKVLISEDSLYVLSKEELNSDETYTAVYYPKDAAVYTIHYHSPDGSVLHSVEIAKSEEDSTFVAVIDGEEQVVIGAEATAAIHGVLNGNQQFRTWYYKNDMIVEWDAFKNKSVKEIMSEIHATVLDIYPVVREAVPLDSAGEQMNYGGEEADITVTLVGERENDINIVMVDVNVNKDYTESNLTIHVEDVCYDETGEATKRTPVNDMIVDLNLTSGMGGGTMNQKTDAKGDAVFTFMGLLKIKKTVLNGDGTGAFLFSITGTTISGENKSVKIVVKESTDENDNTVILEMPYGSYTVAEDYVWAWRYKEIPSATAVISNAEKAQEIEYTFKNELTNSKWFADEDNNTNVFKAE